jgi:hypothetical protein
LLLSEKLALVRKAWILERPARPQTLDPVLLDEKLAEGCDAAS